MSLNVTLLILVAFNKIPDSMYPLLTFVVVISLLLEINVLY